MTGNGPSTPKQMLRPQARALPKRFYTRVSVTDAAPCYSVLLDDRPIRTPRKHQLALPSRALADAIASEWAAQDKSIDPATMPLTRIANTTIDGVTERTSDVAADVVHYAASDALLYRADHPQGLVDRQTAQWSPIVQWAQSRLDMPLAVTRSLMAVSQPAGLKPAFLALIPQQPFALAALHAITTLTGSAILALAVLEKHLTPEAAWEAAHVDEDWQISQWGADSEAEKRRAFRWQEMKAAADTLKLLGQVLDRPLNG